MSKTLLFALLVGLVAAAHANRSLKQYDVYGGGTATTPTPAPTPLAPSGVTGGASAGAAMSPITTTAEGLSVNPWMLGQNYADQAAKVGQTITFTWPMSTHGLYIIPTGDCPQTFKNGQNGQQAVQEPTAGPKTATFTFNQAMTYWFACPVDGHCAAGMKLKVTVS